MFTWFKRVLAASILGFIGAIAVPFLSIEVYRFLLRLGADNYQILIRLSNRFQTPAEFFTQEMILFGAILGIGSGYMIAMQHERRLREVWMLSKICSVFAILFLYSLLVHPAYIVLGKQEKANALPLVFTSFLVPASWSILLLLWGYKIYGEKELATKQWNRQKVKKELGHYLHSCANSLRLKASNGDTTRRCTRPPTAPFAAVVPPFALSASGGG